MARIRSVKPELRRDLTVGTWPRDARYAWVLLWGYLDDHGRGLDDLRLLTADLFPLDRDVTEKKLDSWLNLMTTSTEKTAPLCRYQVNGQRYLHAPKWGRSQRVSHPQDSRIPPCPHHELDGAAPEPDQNSSGIVPESFATSRAPEDLGSKGAREQGSKGDGARERGSARATSGGGSTQTLSGTLLNEHLAIRRMPASASRQLELRIIECLEDDHTQPDDIRAGLDEWRRRPGAKPGLLPHLVADAIQTRQAHNEVTDPTADPELAAAIARKEAERAAQQAAYRQRQGASA